MPDSVPEEYKKLAQKCWDADPDKRPNASELSERIQRIKRMKEHKSVNSWNSEDSGDDYSAGYYWGDYDWGDDDSNDILIWDTIYNVDVKPLSRLAREKKYSSKLLPTGDLPKPRNSNSTLPNENSKTLHLEDNV